MQIMLIFPAGLRQSLPPLPSRECQPLCPAGPPPAGPSLTAGRLASRGFAVLEGTESMTEVERRQEPTGQTRRSLLMNQVSVVVC